MAVKPQKIEERLMELFPKAKNLSKARKAKITASLAKIPADDADDTAIDAVISQYNDAIDIEELARQDDSIRTMKAKLDAQGADPKPDEDEPKQTDPPKPAENGMPEWARGFMSKLDSVTNELSEIKKGKVIENKMETAKSLFAKSLVLKKLPAKVQDRYLRTLNLEDAENSIEDQIAEMEAESEEFVQGMADSEDIAGPPPINTGGNKMSDEEIDSIISSASR